MNHLKHSLLNLSELIVNAIVKGNVECYDYIHNESESIGDVKFTIYEKEDAAVYVIEDWNWFNNERYDSITYLCAKGIPEDDLRRIEKVVKEMLKVRR